MKIIDTFIEGLKVIELDVHRDHRGFFVERFNEDSYKKLRIETNYFQDNHSFSIPRVIRGLHYQNNPSQLKIVGCIRGSIFDVAVDIRKNSPTFGKYFALELNAVNGKMLYIPEGFAHGFCVLGSEPADVIYKVNNPYNKEGEGGILYNDPEIAIDWPIKDPIISKKDAELQSFKEYRNSQFFNL